MKFIDKVNEKEFNQFVSNHPNGHFLKSVEWGKVSKINGWIPFYVGLKSNNKLIATALLLKKSLPFGFSYFYIPRGYTMDYNNFDVLEVFTQEINKFTKKHKALFFKIDPDVKLHTIDKDANVIEGENNYELVDKLRSIGFKRKKLNKFFENEQPRFTFRVMLDSEENVDKRYSKTVHRFIKKSNFYGVETYLGKKEEIKEFVRLMKLTEKRQNFFSHKGDYYEKFYDIFKKNDHVDLMLAKINVNNIINNLDSMIESLPEEDVETRNKKIEEREFFKSKLSGNGEIIISAYFTVFYGNKSWYLYGANDMEFKNTMANYKLFDFQIKQSLNRQIETFDEFGTIGDTHTNSKLLGLYEFKKKFGGEYIEFIGEFDYIQKPIINFLYRLIIPVRRYFVRKKLKRQGK